MVQPVLTACDDVEKVAVRAAVAALLVKLAAARLPEVRHWRVLRRNLTAAVPAVPGSKVEDTVGSGVRSIEGRRACTRVR